MTTGPDDAQTSRIALVLSGGGARAAYQVGVLAAIAECAPQLQIQILAGVSAGAINIAHLAAHRGEFATAVHDLREEWRRLTPDRVYCVRPTNLARASLRWFWNRILRRETAPGVMRGLMDMSPLRRFLAGCIDFQGVEANIEAGRLRAAALTATSYTTGQTVTFVQGIDGLPVWERSQRIGMHTKLTLEHVIASAAIPIIFPAVKLPDGFYGDGSVRQIAPLAPAIHLGATHIIAVSMRAKKPSSVPVRAVGEYPATAEVMSLLFNAVFLDSLEGDAERLDRINQLLAQHGAERRASAGLRPIRLLMLKPSRDLGAMSRGFHHLLPASVRRVVESLGSKREGSVDFVSYLLFEPSYTDLLVELGFEDAMKRRGEIDEFLGA
ncbi:MAG: patatin-like phospholipase family protein [Gemmatimonadales bacterium]